ncbi:MAG: PKD domain-containing protein [Bacteroidales bacterium]
MRIIVIVLLVCTIISCNDKGEEIEPQVIADFIMQIDEINYHRVHFLNKSENAIVYFWDFGNGDSSNLENPSYTYASAGYYDVTLTAYGASGSEDSMTQTLILCDITSPLNLGH